MISRVIEETPKGMEISLNVNLQLLKISRFLKIIHEFSINISNYLIFLSFPFKLINKIHSRPVKIGEKDDCEIFLIRYGNIFKF